MFATGVTAGDYYSTVTTILSAALIAGVLETRWLVDHRTPNAPAYSKIGMSIFVSVLIVGGSALGFMPVVMTASGDDQARAVMQVVFPLITIIAVAWAIGGPLLLLLTKLWEKADTEEATPETESEPTTHPVPPVTALSQKPVQGTSSRLQTAAILGVGVLILRELRHGRR